MQNAISLASPSLSPSFRAIYEQHIRFVRSSVARRGVPAAAVDDVVQDVFAAVHLNLATFSGESPIKHWISGIMRNVVLMYFRKRENRVCLVELEEQHELAPNAQTAEDRFDKRVMLGLLSKTLRGMTEGQRQAYWLYEIEEMPGSQVAQTLGVSENTVRMRVRAARRQLARGVEELTTSCVRDEQLEAEPEHEHEELELRSVG